MEEQKILVINPGSTSTKIAVYQGTLVLFLKSIKHSIEELRKYNSIIDQLEYRKELVLKNLEDENIKLSEIAIIMGRGGLIKPIESGIYEVNDRMINDLKSGIQGEHASNLGGLIAIEIARIIPGARAYICDPVVVDELQDVARITGHPMFIRRSIFHALNQKAIARSYAHSINKRYEDLNLIVAHLGGGVSIGAHQHGKVIDVNQALDGEGPMSPERSGTLPVGDLVDVCFSGQYDHKTLHKMINGEGGYVAYFGTNDAHLIATQAKNNDQEAKRIQEGLGYQVAKYIGMLAVVLKGKTDAILMTGGMANNKELINYIGDHVSFLAPFLVYPGEDEMKALARNALRVLNNEIKVKNYI